MSAALRTGCEFIDLGHFAPASGAPPLARSGGATERDDRAARGLATRQSDGPRVEQRLSPAGVRHAAMHARSARRRRVDRERAADGADALAHVRDPRAELRFGRVKPRA